MSNAIQFLEAVGCHPALIQRSAEAYAEEVAALELDEAQRQALLKKDHATLNNLLNGRTRMLCAVATPDDESEQEVIPDNGDADGDSVPDDESPPARE
jgi:hypothetical protein